MKKIPKNLKLNKKYPPIYGYVSIPMFTKAIDHEDFPVCSSCGARIYNPLFYEDKSLDMCGPCITGESDTVMWHKEEIDERYEDEEFNQKIKGLIKLKKQNDKKKRITSKN